MAVAYDSSSQGFTGGTSGSFSHTCSGSNRYLFVVSASVVSAVEYNGVSLTLLTTYTPPSYGGNQAPILKVWGLADPATGANNVTFTTSAATTVVASSYTGASSSQPDALNTGETGADLATEITNTVTTITDNSWLVGFIGGSANSGRSLVGGTSTTLRQSSSDGGGSQPAIAIVDSNAAKTPVGGYSLNTDWSSGTGRLSGVIFAVDPYISYTFTGPSSGNVNSASTNFTVTPDAAINGTITITPSGAGSTGLDPVILTFSNSATPQTFTITPTVAGSITLTPTNGLGLPNPGFLTYTANAVVPGAPVIGTAVPGNTTASVAFSAPSNNGGATITNYTATSDPGGLTGTGASSPVTVTGLTNGVAYTFTVTATNSAGTGAASSASNSVTPYVAATSYTFTGPTSGNVRSASTNFTVTPNAVYYGTITITPSGAGSSGLSPTILTYNGSSSAQTFTITPLDSGIITLTGTNSSGLSNPAVINYTASAVVPLAPTIGSVVPGIEQIAVSVVAPTNDGGDDILSYAIVCSNGETKATSAPGEVVFTGLTPGTSYTFYANCTNGIGTSANSATTDAATPLDQSAIIYNNAPKFDLTPGVGNVLSF